MELNKRLRQAWQETSKDAYSNPSKIKDLTEEVTLKKASREFPPLVSPTRDATLRKLKNETEKHNDYNEFNPIIDYSSTRTDYSNESWITHNGHTLTIGSMHFSHLVNARNYICYRIPKEGLEARHLGVTLRIWYRIFTHEIHRRVEPLMRKKGFDFPINWTQIPNFHKSAHIMTDYELKSNSLSACTLSELEGFLHSTSKIADDNFTRFLFIYRQDRSQVLALAASLLELHKESSPPVELNPTLGKSDKPELKLEPIPKQLSLF